MSKGTLVQNQLDDFNSVIIDLKSLDVKFEDDDKAILLIFYLFALYKHIFQRNFVKANLLSK